ncbi:hypothetical protein M9H77_29695 [Catharanthus roseus]|uniref:Uncharacterized protein n=1 Tax=Catharanthus roseus TaxID=4058 RepID=A0ACB9ZZD6_CATRO|nr:hypothetical protein M9H77_29695 [Catharanthus roseus]
MVKTKNANGEGKAIVKKVEVVEVYKLLLAMKIGQRRKGKLLPDIELTYQTWELHNPLLQNVCPMVVFLTKVFQHFKITFFRPNDHIGIGKIYNQNTFKRMGFSRTKDGRLIRRAQAEDSKNSEKEEEEEGNEPEENDSETEVERIRREIRRKKRQERTEEGSSSGSMNQVMEMIASLQTSIYTWLDALDSKMSDIQERTKRAPLKSQGYTLRGKTSW